MVAQDLDPLQPRGILDQQAGLQHVLPRIVHPGDQRDADDERPARSAQPCQIAQDGGIVHPCPAAMLHRVGVLHVEQHQIGVPRHPAENIRRGIAARLDGRMHPAACNAASTSAANAACRSGSPPVSVTPPRFMAYTALLRSSLPASSPSRSRTRTSCGRRGDPYTAARGNALGIVAPGTAKRAPFQENGGADTRPVVYGELLDAENNPFLHCAVRSFGQI